MTISKGTLFLIPSLISQSDISYEIPSGNLKHIELLDEFIVENIRAARRFLRKIGYKQDFDNVIFHLIDKHTKISETIHYLKSCINGENIGLLSEAGLPCIADPGATIVLQAHQSGIKVKPLVGPSSIFLALMSSGLNGQQFTFHGYLPIDNKILSKKIKNLENDSAKSRYSQIFMEAPHRNLTLYKSLIEQCKHTTLLSIASNINEIDEMILTKSIGNWIKSKTPNIHKRPSIFIINSN